MLVRNTDGPKRNQVISTSKEKHTVNPALSASQAQIWLLK